MEKSYEQGTLCDARNTKNIYKKLPINLLRKAKREARNQNRTKQKITNKKYNINLKQAEQDALIHFTEQKLRCILATEGELLADVPYDATPDELLGMIALEQNHATTVYVERNGLSTLTVVLPQKQPTIANLKRAIEATARVELKRELKQQQEQEEQEQQQQEETCLEQQNTNIKTNATIVNEEQQEPHNTSNDNNNDFGKEQRKRKRQQQVAMATALVKPIRNKGELVYSTAFSGHYHRPNVSWRFLWRAFILFNVDTNLPINDENGRKLLSEFNIKNATKLKFCKREIYMGRTRQ